MSDFDVYGEPINPFITDSNYVDFNLTGASDYLNNLIEGYQTYFIGNTSPQDDNDPNTTNAVLLIINQEPSSDAVNSFDVGFYDLTFSASGYFTYYATASGVDPNVIRESGITESAPQGYFPPISTYPTESFFRGWGESDYFETDEDGEVFRVGSGEGFSSDTLGNFNTGSYELDNDNEVPYKKSRYPWFMNARESTIMALSASRTVGLHDRTDLQLYTGSITASSVPIGPAFNIATPPTPEEATVTFNPNSPPPPDLSITVGGNAGASGPYLPVNQNCYFGLQFNPSQTVFYSDQNGPGSTQNHIFISIITDPNGPTVSWNMEFTDGTQGGSILSWGKFNGPNGNSDGTISGTGNAQIKLYPNNIGIPVNPPPTSCPGQNRVGYLNIYHNGAGEPSPQGYFGVKQLIFNGGVPDEENP